jgi:hypothetical protein
MTVTYQRMFHRWDILRGWIPGILFFLVAVGIELVFYYYMISRGLINWTFNLYGSSLTLSLPLLFCLGAALFLLTLWVSVFGNTAYVMAGPDRKIRRILYPIRMIRAAALILVPFTIVLFLPYFVESSWFISSLNSISSLKSSATGFYNWSFGLTRMDPTVKFVISQLSAAVAAVIVASVQLWRVKGTRNLTLLLRRRRRR